MSGILDAGVAGQQPDKAKAIAESGNPQAIMAALAGQAGVDPYKVLAAVKSETDKRKMMQAQMGNQAIQQAQQMPSRTVAQELIAQLQPPAPQQQGPGFAEGGVVSTDGWNREFWNRDSEFNDFLRFLRDNNKVTPGREVLDVQRIDPQTLQALRVEFDTTRRRINPSRQNYDWSRAIPGGPDNPLPPTQPMPNLGADIGNVPVPDFVVADPQAGKSSKSAGMGGGVAIPVKDRFKLTSPTYKSAQLQAPEELTAEQLRAREDALASKDMTEYDAAMQPLAERRRKLYEEQKANRPTRFDAALDGVLGTDIRGRRLGSGLAAMAAGGRRSEREANARAAQQDEAMIQAEELMARARMEARRGNREAAAKLVTAARQSVLDRLGVTNRNLEGATAADNKTAESQYDAAKYVREDEIKQREMAQRAAIASAQIAAQDRATAARRAHEDKYELEKLRVRADSMLNSNPQYKGLVEQYNNISKISTPAMQQQAAQLKQQIDSFRSRVYQELGIPITLAGEPQAGTPPGPPSGAMVYKLIPE